MKRICKFIETIKNYCFMKKVLIIFVLFVWFNDSIFSQGKFVVNNLKKSDKVHFKLINNLIIIPVELNDVELAFILDTGVSKTILFNYLNLSDSLKIRDTEPVYLRGLGEGESLEALKSRNNKFKIGDAIKVQHELFAITNDKINFAPRLGISVHGIIGYDLFKDLVVEINYSRKFIILTEPERYRYRKCKKCETLNLEFYNNKPYLNAYVKINSKSIPVKLLIDSGGSDALWLFEDEELGLSHSEKYFNDFLGHGLSGSVYGKRSKLDEFSLNRFVLKNANVAFPDSSSISFAKKNKDRNGSLAGNILKRFNMVLDYQKAIIVLKKNSLYRQEFSYNKSGIELAHDGVRTVKIVDFNFNRNNRGTVKGSNEMNSIILSPSYESFLEPVYTIVELRKDSPAERVGLQLGDVVLSVNGKAAHKHNLQDLMKKFYDKEGTRIKLVVERNSRVFTVYFQLENLFQ